MAKNNNFKIVLLLSAVVLCFGPVNVKANTVSNVVSGVDLVGTYVNIFTQFYSYFRAEEDIEDTITIHNALGSSPLIIACAGDANERTLRNEETYSWKVNRKFKESYWTCCNFIYGEKKLLKKQVNIAGGGTHSLDIYAYDYGLYIAGDTDVRRQREWHDWTMDLNFQNQNSRCYAQELKEVWLFQDKDLKGSKKRLTLKHRGSCFNLNYDSRTTSTAADWNDVLTSVELQGNCIRLHEHQGCTGDTLELSPTVNTNCQTNLGNCGWNDRASSINSCDVQLTQIYDRSAEFGSRGGKCKDECWPRGTDYFWCNLEGGSWDYCSPRSGMSYYGDVCKEPCAYHGNRYRWCWLEGGGQPQWGYCS